MWMMIIMIVLRRMTRISGEREERRRRLFQSSLSFLHPWGMKLRKMEGTWSERQLSQKSWEGRKRRIDVWDEGTRRDGRTRKEVSWQGGRKHETVLREWWTCLAENFPLLSLLLHSERIFLLQQYDSMSREENDTREQNASTQEYPTLREWNSSYLRILLSLLRTFTERCTEWFSSWIVEHHKLYPGKSLTIRKSSFFSLPLCEPFIPRKTETEGGR